MENFFYLVRVHNQGVGFGNGTAWVPVVFLLVPVVALTLLRIFWKKGVSLTRSPRSPWRCWSAASPAT
ncbi:MAG: hypothetical protein WCJ14_10785 [Verrucomicrobiota bacterium]